MLILLGKSTVVKAVSGERGQNVTVEMWVNACGDCIPPFYIFKAQK